MRGKLKKGYVAVAIVAIAIVLVSISMITPALSSTEDFSIFNSGWNGTSALAISTYKSGKFVPSFVTRATGTDIEVVQLGFEQLGLNASSSALVVIGPTLGFSESDGDTVRDFVRGGGVLFLADDFGTGNELLEGIGASTRISGTLVMDLAFDKKPEFSVCFDLRTDPLTRNVSSLLLNYPSSLSVDATSTKTVAYSSIASWQDSNGNKERDLGEPSGPFPILAREKLGNGTVIVLSDPSVLINGMAKNLNNSVLDDNLISEISTGRASVFFDESHRGFFNPVAVAMKFTSSTSDEAKGLIVVLAFFLVLWMATDYIDRALSEVVRRAKASYALMMNTLFRWAMKTPKISSPTLELLEKEVLQMHPGWRPGLLRYIVKEHVRHSEAADEKNRK